MNKTETGPSPGISRDVLEGYLSEREYARQHGLTIRTAQRHRKLRKSPPFIVVGRQVYYRVVAIREWLLSQEHHFHDEGVGRRKRPTFSPARRRCL